MNKNESYKFLEETFHASFDENKYLKFINEMFNGSFEFKRSKIFVHSSFNDYISEAYDLGKYVNKKELCVLVIKLKKSSSLERARTMQRNFVANYLKYKNTDASLIAFCDENLDDWRFSFVKVDFLINKTEKGKLKTTEDITPVKRYSYLVGKNESNHTCQKQLEKFIVEEKINPLIEDIEKSFSVDNVTKEFFEEYKKLFVRLKYSINELIETDNKIKTEFLEKDVDSVSFSKKLLGQIVFLYFLQKKGWLGVTKNNLGDFNKWGSGPKDFLKQLFNKTFIDYNNFFNDILEPLFYEALAIDRKDNNDYYSRFKCKIPFLNGGLFEPINNYSWEKTDVLINNDIFKDIFDVFDRFNFTIKEDEPLDKEVAVDPEMLGKVFENLLDVNDRKSKGAFYTPREIVHYMCQQSLINYLETNLKKESVSKEDIEYFVVNGEYTLSELIREQEEIKHKTYGSSVNRFPLPESIKNNYNTIDKLLVNVKIADPAVGSGAFPVGMMTEIVKCRSILTFLFSEKEQKKRTNYYLKRETIENSLYGVDIEPSAVEIAKLRFWLSLIVDEEDIDNINPLPNLDHKIMCGNSLLDSFEGVKLFNNIINNKTKDKEIYQTKLFDSKSDFLFKKLQKLQKEYFNESSRTKKNELKAQIDKIEWDFIENKLKEQNSKEALEKLQKIKKSKSKPFFIWELYFNDVFNRENPGFDIVIGNPPYGQNKLSKSDSIILSNKINSIGKKNEGGTQNLAPIFTEFSYNLLNKNGNLTFIINNGIARVDEFKKFRDFLLTKTNIREIVDTGNPFDGVTLEMVILFLDHTVTKEIKINSFRKNLVFNILKNIFIKYNRFIFYFDSFFEKIMGKSEINIIYGSRGKSLIFKKIKDKDFNIPVCMSGRTVHKYYIDYKYVYWTKKDGLSKSMLSEFNLEYLISIRGGTNKYRVAYKPKQFLSADGTSRINISNKELNEKYVMALLNSKLYDYIVSKYLLNFSELTITINNSVFKSTPIKNISLEAQKPFIQLVDQILLITKDEDYLKNTNKQVKVKKLKKEIDNLVYDLYELTPEEIKIVDKFGLI